MDEEELVFFSLDSLLGSCGLTGKKTSSSHCGLNPRNPNTEGRWVKRAVAKIAYPNTNPKFCSAENSLAMPNASFAHGRVHLVEEEPLLLLLP